MVQGPVVQRGYVQVGIVGKPNAGKSTFFAAATMRDVGIAPVPFTTVEPNVGIGYVRVECHCVELGLQCSPRNSFIMGRYRFVPVQLIDVAGLVPGAWQGRGLGNRFLDHVRRAPVLVHVVDASGGTDEEGRVVRPGTHDPLRDVEFLEGELAMWMTQMLERDWDRVVRAVEYAKQRLQDVLYERLSGLGFSRGVVEAALDDAGLRSVSPSKWGGDALPRFARALLRLGKPMVIAANKIDVEPAPSNYERMRGALGDRPVVPTSAEAELALRRAQARGIVRYVPGDPDFEVVGAPTEQQRGALERIRAVMARWGGTGVVRALNAAVFDALGYVAVFPVEDERRLSDREGNVLPDVLLVPRGATARDVAYMIHTDLGEGFVTAIDVQSGRRLAADAPVRHRMIIKIVARA